jgi:hypothetical protein
MLAHYLGPRARYLRPVARGGYYNKGEGIRMALAIGAAPSGDYGSFHAEPVDPRSGAPEPIVLVFNYGILVNSHGQRFTDEAPATVDATYESITRLIFDQPAGIAYVILDARIEDVPGWKRSVRSLRLSRTASENWPESSASIRTTFRRPWPPITTPARNPTGSILCRWTAWPPGRASFRASQTGPARSYSHRSLPIP